MLREAKFFPFPPEPPVTAAAQTHPPSDEPGVASEPVGDKFCKVEFGPPELSEAIVIDSESDSSESVSSGSGEAPPRARSKSHRPRGGLRCGQHHWQRLVHGSLTGSLAFCTFAGPTLREAMNRNAPPRVAVRCQAISMK